MLQTSVIGHVGGDAETKNQNGKEFTVFRVANTERWTDEKQVVHEDTTWVDCILSGKPSVVEFLKKGQQVYVAGSTKLRVYSSAKDKCMKAGLTINVKQIELLGGKTDEVPKVLFTADGGKEVQVNKYYHAAEMQRDMTQPESIALTSRSGERFIVNRDGWVSKEPVQTT